MTIVDAEKRFQQDRMFMKNSENPLVKFQYKQVEDVIESELELIKEDPERARLILEVIAQMNLALSLVVKDAPADKEKNKSGDKKFLTLTDAADIGKLYMDLHNQLISKADIYKRVFKV